MSTAKAEPPLLDGTYLERAYGQEFMRMVMEKATLLQRIGNLTEEAMNWKMRFEVAQEELNKNK